VVHFILFFIEQILDGVIYMAVTIHRDAAILDMPIFLTSIE